MRIITPEHGLFAVSNIIFGCGAVGGLLINGKDEEKQDTFELAIRSGVNWFDTAPSYGAGVSESSLGCLLTTADAAIQVSTKVSIDSRDSDYYGQVERSLSDSLRRLNKSRVTLIQLHNPIANDTNGRVIGNGIVQLDQNPIANDTNGRVIGINEIMKPHGVLDALDNIKMQGMASEIGITGLGETAALLKVIKSNRLASMQLVYNLLNASAAISMPPSWPHYNFTGLVDTCFEHGVAVFGIRAFAAGILATTQRHGKEQPLTPSDTIASEQFKQQHLSQVLFGHKKPDARLALRFALSQPRIHAVIIGLAQTKHLEMALRATEEGPLDEQSLAQIQTGWRSFKG